MIDSLYNKTCIILRRVEDSRDTWNRYQFVPFATVNCIWTEKSGSKIKSSSGEDVVIIGYIVLSEEVLETDKFVIDNFIHEQVSGGIIRNQNVITGEVEFYKIAIERRREYNENEITVDKRDVE